MIRSGGESGKAYGGVRLSPATEHFLEAAGDATLRATVPLLPTGLLLLAACLTAWLLRRSLGRAGGEPGGPGNRPWPAVLIHAPGNVFHESAHALGMLVAGYRVARIRFVFNCDRPGAMGYCQAGEPWAFWANRPLLALLSAPAPVILGALAFRGVLAWMGVDTGTGAGGLPDDLGEVPVHAGAVFTSLLDAMRQARLEPGPVAVLAVLGFLVGAHTLPSGADLRALAPLPVLAILAGALLVAGADRGWPFFPGAWEAWRQVLDVGLGAVNDLLGVGAVCGLAAWVVTLPVAWVAGAARG